MLPPAVLRGALLALVILLLPAVAFAHGDDEVTLAVKDGLRLTTHVDDGAIGRDSAGQTRALRRMTTRARMGNLATQKVRASDAASGWCGTPRTADYPAGTPTRPYVKVVYAYPTDRANRFSQFADAIQANVAAIERFMSAQSGGTRDVRFDMGTDCGAGYVDIATVALAGPRSNYVDANGNGRIDLIDDEVANALGSPTGVPVNYLVVGESLGTNDCNCVRGTGMEWNDSSKAGAAHAQGGLAAVVWGPDGGAAPGAGPWVPLLFLHETTHTFGGVQSDAPHATLYGHCTDEWDVMCYDDGSNMALSYVCPKLSGDIDESYDCGRDDYFNPSPAPGSYLATHWNVYDSTFLETPGEQPAPVTPTQQTTAPPPTTTQTAPTPPQTAPVTPPPAVTPPADPTQNAGDCPARARSGHAAAVAVAARPHRRGRRHGHHRRRHHRRHGRHRGAHTTRVIAQACAPVLERGSSDAAAADAGMGRAKLTARRATHRRYALRVRPLDRRLPLYGGRHVRYRVRACAWVLDHDGEPLSGHCKTRRARSGHRARAATFRLKGRHARQGTARVEISVRRHGGWRLVGSTFAHGPTLSLR